ncbi:RagB/SusD family nutrient uptake outer membrane protein [Hymenobacter sp. BT175]|uniref:RagB/SusD family nutrient uptake outer membrane protein n=1 Tax=Hymenobacter translucens TaxID=2886507 RepID=UPI001D0E53B9|nr:RagB/SusD family nutrient uptake outer membrane protein [Hymenobacter translucens]MCC2545305.1 RagB/SusD family nutrient uptake outer membrane protein [Hymenobacter translucens]
MLRNTLSRVLTVGCLAAGAVLTSSCEKFLDIKPITELPYDQSFNTVGKVDAFVLYGYGRLASSNFYGGQVQIVSELFGDNLNFTAIQGSGGDNDFRNRQFSLFSNPGSGIWSTGYQAIANSNLVIDAVDRNLFDAEQPVKNRLKGEALFIRAIAHFELVRLFAKPYSNNPGSDPGIVLRTKVVSANEAKEKVGRARVGEVYTQVISDLQEAASLLPAQNGDRATSWAAKALLARVYLDQNNYSGAAQQADDVIQNGGFSLGTPPESVVGPFRTTGQGQRHSSVIFQLVNQAGADAAGSLRNAFYSYFGGSVRLYLNDQGPGNIAEALRLRGGLRYDSLVVVNEPGDPTTATPYPYSSKYRGTDPFASAPINIPIIRLQEMYLTRAEARAAQGGSTDAAIRADINAVRQAAGRPADNTTAGQAALLALVRDERRLELFLENDRFHQLRRLQLPSRGTAFNSGRVLLIPLDEVNGNPGIEQNGGD